MVVKMLEILKMFMSSEKQMYFPASLIGLRRRRTFAALKETSYPSVYHKHLTSSHLDMLFIGLEEKKNKSMT